MIVKAGVFNILVDGTVRCQESFLSDGGVKDKQITACPDQEIGQ
jgi:hypothetical protein